MFKTSRNQFIRKIVVLWFIGLWSVAGCGGAPEQKVVEVKHPISLPSPIAILIAEDPDLMFKNEVLLQQAYDRLEAKSWQLLSGRAGVQVVERRNLEILRAEQQVQHSYAMDEESAVRLGQLTGAKAVLVYWISLPSWRDRFLIDDDQPLPFTLAGRLLEVETGAILWADTVTVSSSDCQPGTCWFGGRPRTTLWPILAKGVDQLISEFARVIPQR